MQSCGPQHRQRLGSSEHRRTREVEALRVLPGTKHYIVERQQCHIIQHQRGYQFIDAEMRPRNGRHESPERSGGRSEYEHQGNRPEGRQTGKIYRHRGRGHCSDGQLAFRADIPYGDPVRDSDA
ncbi:hypothetical protein D3C81_1676050 [compost metagenome]